MMTRLMLWASAAMLSLSLMACEDILIPDDPGNGGGGGGDTTQVVNKLTLSGMLIGDETTDVRDLPEDARIALVWQRLDGTGVVRSIGSIDRNTMTWTINVNGALDQADFLETAMGKGVYGMASIVLLAGDPAEGYVIGEELSTGAVYPLGVAPLTQVIYDTDVQSADEFAQSFLGYFGKGYSAASIFPLIGNEGEEDPTSDVAMYRPAPSTNILVVYGDVVTVD